MYFLDNATFELISSNAPVENYPVWSSDDTYNTGDRVIYNNKIWESVIDNNDTEPADDNINWAFISYINSYKCIDDYINTQTTNYDDDLIMEFTFEKADAIAFFNLHALALKVEIYDNDDNLITTITKDLITNISDFGDYFFSQDDLIAKMTINIPYMFFGKAKITLTKTDFAGVGLIQIGYKKDLGITLMGVRSSIDDYSKKETDDAGNTYLAQGNYADRVECKVTCPVSEFNNVKKRLVDNRGLAKAYIASEDDKFRELNLYGFYESFEIDIDNETMLECSLTLRSLI